jgi:hypothetical protein
VTPTLVTRPVLPVLLMQRMEEMLGLRLAGQIMINLNDGKVSSFEIKEHYRVP